MRISLRNEDRPIEVPDALFGRYLWIVRNCLVGSGVTNDQARADAHRAIQDWFWSTFGSTVDPAEFQIAMSKAMDDILAREISWKEEPVGRLRAPLR